VMLEWQPPDKQLLQAMAAAGLQACHCEPTLVDVKVRQPGASCGSHMSCPYDWE
jgi:hypothetical protein